MKKLKILKLIALCFLTVFVATFVFIKPNVVMANGFAGGDGSPGDPYQIADCGQLQQVKFYLDKDFVLINDINCSTTTEWDCEGEGEGRVCAGFEPIIDMEREGGFFRGIFNGRGKTISNLFINRPSGDWVGLFSFLDAGAEVKNLNLINVDIMGGEESEMGGLVARNFGSISNVYISGKIQG